MGTCKPLLGGEEKKTVADSTEVIKPATSTIALAVVMCISLATFLYLTLASPARNPRQRKCPEALRELVFDLLLRIRGTHAGHPHRVRYGVGYPQGESWISVILSALPLASLSFIWYSSGVSYLGSRFNNGYGIL